MHSSCLGDMPQTGCFFAEALIYGTAIGAGFAFLENIFYVALLPGFSLGDAILRGFGTAVLHMGCTALYAASAVTVSRVMAGKPFPLTFSACSCSIVPSFVIHYVYNLFLLPEFLQLVLVILLMTGLLIVINDIDEKLIHKWHITAGFNKRGAPERHFSRRIPHGDASQVPAGRLF